MKYVKIFRVSVIDDLEEIINSYLSSTEAKNYELLDIKFAVHNYYSVILIMKEKI